jgi:hypothetical protein
VNVVGMFMGHQDGTDRLRLDTQAVKALHTFFQGKAEINQKAGVAIINERAVTLAATAQ